MSLTLDIAPATVAARLEQAFPGIVIAVEEGAVVVGASRIVEALLFLRDDEELDCKYLNCLTAVDWITHFDIVYHLSSLAKNNALVVKARASHDNPIVPSVTSVWMAAHLQEREAYDLMGIVFTGHPDLKRIFLWDGFPGHPLRKDFLALPGGFKPGLQRFPFEFPEGQRAYASLSGAEATSAPRVPRLDLAQSELPIIDPEPVKEVATSEPIAIAPEPTGAGADPAKAGGTAAAPADTIDRAHSGPGEPQAGRADSQGAPGEGASS